MRKPNGQPIRVTMHGQQQVYRHLGTDVEAVSWPKITTGSSLTMIGCQWCLLDTWAEC